MFIEVNSTLELMGIETCWIQFQKFINRKRQIQYYKDVTQKFMNRDNWT